MAPVAARAQDRQAPPSLEELIPDSAVANPEEWAGQGAPAAPDEDAAVEAMAEVDPDSPLADLPPIDLPWPDSLELPQLAPLEPDDTIQYAEAVDAADPAGLADADVLQITPELVLAFPPGEAAFPERAAFTERFGELSTIAELDTDEDNIAQIAARAKADEELLATMLRVYGYYDSQVIRSIGAIAPGVDSANERPVVRFDLVPGRGSGSGRSTLATCPPRPMPPRCAGRSKSLAVTRCRAMRSSPSSSTLTVRWARWVILSPRSKRPSCWSTMRAAKAT